ncbi:MAG: hypothetical protein KBD39_09440 [Sterolibacterium sp.]|nr:hypothetical protein [Sterolibacterium sp.]MBP9800325.1 hypothetical protein [Sterolibacterium sp.]
MNSERLEQLLERIAVALEQLVSVSGGGLRPHPKPLLDTEPSEPSETDVDIPPDLVVDDHRQPVLEPFLNSKGISIKVLQPEDPSDQIIDSLAIFLGERYNALSPVLLKIKRAMQTGLPITESLKDRPQVDVSSVCQFCTRLHEIAFLEQYQYQRSPVYLVRAKTTTLPKAQRFFGGQWLERFILQKVKAIHAQISAEVSGGDISFEFLINPQIVLSNGDDFELDVLVSMGDAIYWIEAKSGDYQQHVSKYSKFARILGLDCEHSIMVLTDVADDRCDALSSLFAMMVCNLHGFEEKLLSVVRTDIAQQGAPRDAAR